MVEKTGELPPLPPVSVEPPANPDLPAEPLAEPAAQPAATKFKNRWISRIGSLICDFGKTLFNTRH